MPTRYGLSPWVHQFPDSRRPKYPSARGELTVDVVIIGGGLTGCATAYACASAGVRAMLLERERVGQGNAGRSAGLLLPDPGPAFHDVAGAHGLRNARHVFEMWRRGALDAAALIRRLGINCGLGARADVGVAYRDEEKLLRRELDARRHAGLDASWLNNRQARAVTATDAVAAMRLRDGFGLDPYRACVGLAAAAARRGAAIFERSHVLKVRFNRRNAEVVLAGARIRTAKVVVATGSATPEFKALRRHFKRRESYLVLTEPMPAAMRKQLGRRDITIRDLRIPHHRVRWTKDDRLIIAGADQEETPIRTRQAVVIQRTSRLMYELLTMYPAILGLQPAYGWELPYGETADSLMYIGSHRNFPHHLFALGRGGDSVTGAFLAAHILVRAIQGAPQKADEVLGWNR